MDRRQLLGIAGSLFLFVGVFAPLISVPIFGNMNYFNNGQGDGVLVIIMAAIAIVLSLFGHYRLLLAPGLIALGLMINTYTRLQSRISESVLSIRIEWGWTLLVIGGFAIVIAGLLPFSEPDLIHTPPHEHEQY